LFGGRTGDLYGKRRMFMIGVTVFAIRRYSAAWRSLIVAHHYARHAGRGGGDRGADALALIAQLPEGVSAIGRWVCTPRCQAAAARSGSCSVASSPATSRGVGSSHQCAIAAIVLFLAPRALHDPSTTSGHLDVPGAVTVTGGMLALVYGLSNARATVGRRLDALLSRRRVCCSWRSDSSSSAPLTPDALSIFNNRNRSASLSHRGRDG